jgi:hypothetical protein
MNFHRFYFKKSVTLSVSHFTHPWNFFFKLSSLLLIVNI